jgi:hypothetical protein
MGKLIANFEFSTVWYSAMLTFIDYFLDYGSHLVDVIFLYQIVQNGFSPLMHILFMVIINQFLHRYAFSFEYYRVFIVSSLTSSDLEILRPTRNSPCSSKYGDKPGRIFVFITSLAFPFQSL